MTATYRVRAFVSYNQVRYKIQRLWFGIVWWNVATDPFPDGFISRDSAMKAATELTEVNGGELL